MENSDLLDHSVDENTVKKPNVLLNVMCILGYISNAFFLLFGITFLIIGNEIIDQIFSGQHSDADEIQRIFKYVILALILISSLSIVGLILAHQRKTSGVVIYAFANGIWVIVNFLSLQANNIIFGVLSLAFIIIIALNYKK